MGPGSPPWRQNGASLPSLEGKLAPCSRTRKEGGGGSTFGLREGKPAPFWRRGGGVSNEGLLDLMSVDLVFSGLRADISGKIDLSRVDLDFFAGFVGKQAVNLDFFKRQFLLDCRHFRLVSCGLRLFCWICRQTGCELVSICRIDNEINKSVFRFTDLKVQAHDHKVETSRFQDRHHPMKGSHVHRTQRRFPLMTGTGKV